MSSQQFEKMLQGYSLATAEIIYRLPDHRLILQSYIWQDYDLFPDLPNLHKFLHFWQTKLDGPLHSVRVAHQNLIKPSEVRLVTKEFLLN
ncbi:protein usg [Candidatus Kaiserbacteria bacterium RIFOXYB1_FULL_46_14]|uniref:Protein usg n=1 Tax=Candidatus Kaiserbacteria bacterium RIFOXYB1_FULL_46_14 TaxID=1798531 RepID=A0A1F6FJK9_9BACT|nr:MAG: protein usg [Candidatus Kaiserbacteria bacterium RIFOXYB1_FULL_46_14]